MCTRNGGVLTHSHGFSITCAYRRVPAEYQPCAHSPLHTHKFPHTGDHATSHTTHKCMLRNAFCTHTDIETHVPLSSLLLCAA